MWLLFSSSISWLVSLAIPVVEFVCRGMDTKKRSRGKSPVADGEKTHDRKQQLVMPTQVVLCFRKTLVEMMVLLPKTLKSPCISRIVRLRRMGY